MNDNMAVKTKIASDLFRQKWFRELRPEYKLLWLFLMVESNIVGVFEIDAASWSFFIGQMMFSPASASGFSESPTTQIRAS